MLSAAAARVQDLKRDRRFRYMMLFKNHGAAAGASLEHSHSQLIALPIVPREVRDEVDGCAAALRRRRSGASSATSSIRRSSTARRIIAENADVVALAPYAPRFPFETWILPQRHRRSFEEAPRHEYASLARLLGRHPSRG